MDPDGRISGYLNDSESLAGMGHSAMFVEIYNPDGTSAGFEIYEVGTINPTANNGTVLSANQLDGNMGSAVGSVTSGSVVVSGSGATSAIAINSIATNLTSSLIENMPVTAGVTVRSYSSYEEMRTASENQRYDNILNFDTTQDQDTAIRDMAREFGVNFGKYNVFSNNCTQHASTALSAGGVNTTQFLIPNVATDYISSNNAHTEGWNE